MNLEYLARTVWTRTDKVKGKSVTLAYPDTLVGTDSHTTMVNGLAVLGWGVGGIEAEAAMLGQPISMLIPEVIGFKLNGRLSEGTTATDLVLTVTQMLRKKGVVGKFVEFYGPGLAHLSLEDMATIANMAPEYGATCGFFPINAETVSYLKGTARPAAQVALVEKYAKAQDMFWSPKSPDPEFTDTLELDLAHVESSMAGPKRPQDRVALKAASDDFARVMSEEFKKAEHLASRYRVENANFDLGNGDVVIAAITSCTNTSNPSVMIGAGLLARNAAKRGLRPKPWVKTSLAPGSQVVTEYLKSSGLQRISTSLASIWWVTAAPHASAIQAHCRKTSRKPSRRTIWSPQRYFRAIAILKAASIRMFAPTISPLRRSSWHMHSPDRSGSILLPIRSVMTRKASPFISGISGHRRRKSQHSSARTSRAKPSPSAIRMSSKATQPGARSSVTKGMTYTWDSASTYVQTHPTLTT